MLLITSKVLEILFAKRVKPIIEENKLISKHQFGFKSKHSTIEQVHRLIDKINSSLQAKKYCLVVFLDISQAFDKVWHDGLLHIIKQILSIRYYNFLRSYLSNRHFRVRYGDKTTKYKIKTRVPQGSVLGPLLYLLYTADLPITAGTIIGTFTDDTNIATHKDPATASKKIQNSLNNIEKWTKRWRIKVNEAKCVHVTFTTRHETCPIVQLNGVSHKSRKLTKRNI